MPKPSTQKPVVSLRLETKTKAALDLCARQSGITTAAMAERLIAEALEANGADVPSVREEVRAARGVAMDVKIRVARLLRDVVREMESEVAERAHSK